MRVSTSMYQQASLNALLQQQAKVSHTQQQLATGKRILSPADDPIAAANLVDINQTIAVYEQFNRNADIAEMRLTQEEGVLKSVSNALHRARELAVQGNNETYSASQRKDIAAEIRQILDEVMGLANTTDGNNNFLFAGTMSNTKPFTQIAPGEGQASTFIYNGDQAQRRIQIGPQRTVADSDSGFEVFGKVRLNQIELGPIPSQNRNFANDPDAIPPVTDRNAQFVIDGITITLDQDYSNDFEAMRTAIESQLNAGDQRYEVARERDFFFIRNATPGAGPVRVTVNDQNALDAGFRSTSSMVSVFDALDRLAVALETDRMSGGRIDEIDSALSHVIEFQSTIGSRLNSIDRQRIVNDELIFRMDNIRSEMEDLDYASTISKLNLQLTGMQAAQQTFTKVQNLSLFNYL